METSESWIQRLGGRAARGCGPLFQLQSHQVQMIGNLYGPLDKFQVENWPSG